MGVHCAGGAATLTSGLGFRLRSANDGRALCRPVRLRRASRLGFRFVSYFLRF
jgi:hypothetical protein